MSAFLLVSTAAGRLWAADPLAPKADAPVSSTSASASAPASNRESPAVSAELANAPASSAAPLTLENPETLKAAADKKAAEDAAQPKGHFEFGGYGRVHIASDLRGSTGKSVNIVAHGTRIDEDNYAEIELRREDEWKPQLRTRIVTTLALFDGFFHFTGNPTQSIGVRNMYAQANYKKLILWAGSRMYRGDDIYLLNWWPLDNQNTVGGGASYTLGRGAEGDTMFAVHVGMQRLDDPYQYQTTLARNPTGIGSVSFIQLDRPRTIETFKITHFLRNGPGRKVFGDEHKGIKLSAYGELHQLPAGVGKDPLTNRDKGLPSDSGLMVGGQFGYYTGVRDQFINVFVRHARGIAAYDPLAVPTSFANDLTTTSATETQIAVAGNFETPDFGLQAAGYIRFFRDSSEASTSKQKFDEGTVMVRPHVFLGDHFGIAGEASYQMRRYATPNEDGTGVQTAGMTRLGLIPYFSPAGRGTFKRPQLRLIYSVAFRDAGAKSLYAPEDPTSKRGVEHFLGLGAEWWFNSSSYP